MAFSVFELCFFVLFFCCCVAAPFGAETEIDCASAPEVTVDEDLVICWDGVVVVDDDALFFDAPLPLGDEAATDTGCLGSVGSDFAGVGGGICGTEFTGWMEEPVVLSFR